MIEANPMAAQMGSALVILRDIHWESHLVQIVELRSSTLAEGYMGKSMASFMDIHWENPLM